jgi:hypothetical protein
VQRLTDVRYVSGRMEYRSRHATEPAWALPGYLDDARQIFSAAAGRAAAAPAPADTPLAACMESLRWFPLPAEVHAELAGAPDAVHCHPLSTAGA